MIELWPSKTYDAHSIVDIFEPSCTSLSSDIPPIGIESHVERILKLRNNSEEAKKEKREKKKKNF